MTCEWCPTVLGRPGLCAACQAEVRRRFGVLGPLLIFPEILEDCHAALDP